MTKATAVKDLMIQEKTTLIFCYAGSRENYFGSIGQQNDNNNRKFQHPHV